MVVVAAGLPVAGHVALGEADAGEPLGALPEVEVGDDGADGGAVLDREGGVVELVGDHGVAGHGVGEGDVGGVAVGGLEDDVAGGVLDAGLLGELGEGDPGPLGPEHGPAGDAVDVFFAGGLGQLQQGAEVEVELGRDLAVDAQPVGGLARVALLAAHRAQLGQHALAGRDPRAAVGAGLGPGGGEQAVVGDRVDAPEREHGRPGAGALEEGPTREGTRDRGVAGAGTRGARAIGHGRQSGNGRDPEQVTRAA